MENELSGWFWEVVVGGRFNECYDGCEAFLILHDRFEEVCIPAEMAGAEPLCMRLKIFLRMSGSMMICGRNGAEGSAGLSSLLGCLSTRILLSLVVSVNSGALVRAWTPRLKYHAGFVLGSANALFHRVRIDSEALCFSTVSV